MKTTTSLLDSTLFASQKTNVRTQPSALLSTCLFVLVSLFSYNTQAAEPQPPSIVETWACSYNEGKDIDDLMAARDYYVKQAAKAGLSLGPAYMWSLIKGDVDFDILWLEPHDSPMAYAERMDAEGAAADMADVQARFDAVALCSARNGQLHNAFTKEDVDYGTPRVIVSNACRLNPGVSADHLADFRGHVAGVFNGFGDTAPDAAWTISLINRGANTPDFVTFSVNESHSSYMQYVGALFNTEAGQRLGRHFGMLGQCRSAVWAGQEVIAAPE